MYLVGLIALIVLPSFCVAESTDGASGQQDKNTLVQSGSQNLTAAAVNTTTTNATTTTLNASSIVTSNQSAQAAVQNTTSESAADTNVTIAAIPESQNVTVSSSLSSSTATASISVTTPAVSDNKTLTNSSTTVAVNATSLANSTSVSTEPSSNTTVSSKSSNMTAQSLANTTAQSLANTTAQSLANTTAQSLANTTAQSLANTTAQSLANTTVVVKATTSTMTMPTITLPSTLWVGSCSTEQKVSKVMMNVSVETLIHNSSDCIWQCTMMIATTSCAIPCSLRISPANGLNTHLIEITSSNLSVPQCGSPPVCESSIRGSMTLTDIGWCIISSSKFTQMTLHASNIAEASYWLPSSPVVIQGALVPTGGIIAIAIVVMVIVSAVVAFTYVYVQKHCVVRLQYSARRFFDSTSTNVLVDDDREQNYLFAL